jgi:hypothetical protein
MSLKISILSYQTVIHDQILGNFVRKCQIYKDNERQIVFVS